MCFVYKKGHSSVMNFHVKNTLREEIFANFKKSKFSREFNFAREELFAGI